MFCNQAIPTGTASMCPNKKSDFSAPSFFPAPQTALLVSACILSCIGLILTASLPGLTVSETLSQLAFTLIGLAALFAIYRMNSSQTASCSFWLLCMICIASGFTLWISPISKNLFPWLHAAALLFCPLFAIALCRFRGMRRYGMILLPILLLVFELALLLNWQYSDSLLVLILCSGFYLAALWAGWFGMKHRALFGLMTALPILAAVCEFWALRERIGQHIALASDRSSDLLLLGYEGILSRAALDGAAPLGTGALPFQYLPELAAKAPAAAVVYSAGWIPVLCFYLALIVFLACCGMKALRLQSRFARFASLSILFTLLVQVLFSILMACGYPFLNAPCPFLAGGPAQVANLALVGILLAFVRQNHCTDADFQSNVGSFSDSLAKLR